MIGEQLSCAKRSFITRNVDLSLASQLIDVPPQAGDLVLARVERIRQHTRLEDPQGRRVWLYPGDRVIVATAPRYSTAQFQAVIPSEIGVCHLAAAGGIAADVCLRSSQIKPATELFIEGVLADSDGVALNLERFQTLPQTAPSSGDRLPKVMVIGSDMDAGKTTTACAAIRGLSNAGYRVFGAKLTGTGSGPDYWRMLDAGAVDVADFLDAGFASTVGLSSDRIIEILERIESRALEKGADLVVMEVADGVLQPETASLLATPGFVELFGGVLVAADSAVGAAYVSQRAAIAGLSVLAISGAVTRSPLACQEVVSATALPVFTPDQLLTEEVVETVFCSLFSGDDVALSAVE